MKNRLKGVRLKVSPTIQHSYAIPIPPLSPYHFIYTSPHTPFSLVFSLPRAWYSTKPLRRQLCDKGGSKP